MAFVGGQLPSNKRHLLLHHWRPGPIRVVDLVGGDFKHDCVAGYILDGVKWRVDITTHGSVDKKVSITHLFDSPHIFSI